MSNFDLKIIPSSNLAIVIADSSFGEAAIQIEQSFLVKMSHESEELRQLYKRGMYERDDSNIEMSILKFGEELFNGIFKDKILDLFNRTIGGSRDGQLNIRLMLGDPILNTIQWEVMRFRKEYLGFRHNLFRHPFVVRPVKIPRNTKERLHVLHVAVDPLIGVETVKEESDNFMKLLKGFEDRIKCTELVQETATRENVIDVLFQGVDIWHFTGHGLFNEHNPLESSLILWPSNSKEEYGQLSVRSLRTLATSQNLGFCFLNACDTGRSPTAEEGKELPITGEYFVNMAHSLIESGIPMVVATNHEITVNAATLLSHRFYTSIIKYGKRVDQAIKEARAELYLGGAGILPSDWSCPVLYTRSKYNALGTERLHWEASDIYSIRNIEKPEDVDIREVLR